MVRESSLEPGYKIIAYLTANQEREISGAPLFMKLKDDTELKEMMEDLTNALKADAVKLKNNDYIIISI